MWLLLFFISSALNTDAASINERINHAWELVSNNCNNRAIIEMDVLISQPLTKQEKLNCLEVKKYAFFFNQEYTDFYYTSKEIHRAEQHLNNQSKEALYLAEQAFFFHYLTWQDSVLIYMHSCNDIIKKYSPILSEQQGAFIYFMMANYQLYFDDGDPKNHNIRYQVINKMFAKSITFLKTPNLINQRLLSTIYRSWGSRTLDRVTHYKSLTKQQAKERPRDQKILDHLTENRFMQAFQSAPTNCVEDKVNALSLLGLMHSLLGNCKKANSIFENCLILLKKQYKKYHLIPSQKTICLVFKYKMGNDEKMYGNIPNQDEYIEQLIQIARTYSFYLKSSDQFRYDTYGASPIHMLGSLLLAKGEQEKNQELMSQGAQYLIENFDLRFASKTENNISQSIRKWIGKNEIHFNYRRDDSSEWEDVDSPITEIKNPKSNCIKNLQSELEDNEIIIYKSWPSSTSSNHRLVIGKNKIAWIDCKICNHASLDMIQEQNFDEFKKWAWENYKVHLSPILTQFPRTKKIAIYFNDLTDYDCLIDSPNGNDFSELSFIANKIQVNRIYNLQSYYLTPKVSLNKKVHLTSLIQPQFKPLLFTVDLLKNLFYGSLEILNEKKEDLKNIIDANDIVHLYGHGQYHPSDLGYNQFTMPYFEANQWNDLKNKKNQFNKCNALLIFNTCYSGTSSVIFEYDSDLHTHMLLKGAPAIITSPIRSEDFASAAIFKTFYENLEDGIEPETAFYLAKVNFLKSNTGDNCNPYRWNAYRMISQKKIHCFEKISWFEKIKLTFCNLQYLFSPPTLE